MDYKYDMSHGLATNDVLRMKELIINMETSSNEKMMIVCPHKYERELKNIFTDVRVVPISTELLDGENYIYLTQNTRGVINI